MIKNELKKALYTFYPKNSLSAYNLQLGYIFHTELIYHQQTFAELIRFCKQYFELTKAHREIWSRLYERKELTRVLMESVNLRKEPVTVEE